MIIFLISMLCDLQFPQYVDHLYYSHQNTGLNQVEHQGGCFQKSQRTEFPIVTLWMFELRVAILVLVGFG